MTVTTGSDAKIEFPPTIGHDHAEDWRALFDERAGIAEHNGGLARADAERRAFECCVMEWLWRNPPLLADLEAAQVAPAQPLGHRAFVDLQALGDSCPVVGGNSILA